MGNLCIFSVPPCPLGFGLVVKYTHLISFTTLMCRRWQNFHNGSNTIPVLTMKYDSTESCLYTGDERGEVKVWDLTHVYLNAYLKPQQLRRRRGEAVRVVQ